MDGHCSSRVKRTHGSSFLFAFYVWFRNAGLSQAEFGCIVILLFPYRRGKSFEEKVVLLTHKALYVCTFHYTLEKVVQFRRIKLDMISMIEKGIVFVL